MSNALLESLWKADQPALGTWASASDAIFAALGRVGFDVLVIDCQHGAADGGDAAELLRRMAGVRFATFVRVLRSDPGEIGRVLDAGADGVIVPLVEDAGQAEAAVAACRYLPGGIRSFGPTRPDLGRDPAELEGRVSCFVMVETETAVKNIEAICAVPGLAGVYVGPVDLGISLGISPTSAADSSIVADKVTTVVNACRSAGIVAGINAMTGAEAADFAARGFRFITVSRDLSMLALGASAELEAARGAAPPEG